MNVGIVGTGWVSGLHLDAVKKIPGVQVVGIAGRNTARARELARSAADVGPEPQVWDDGLAMVRAGGLDAVLVLLPPHLHGALEHEIALRVPAALIEKPIGNDLSTTEAVADAFERAGTLVSVGYMNRYRATTTRVRELLRTPNRPVTVNGWWVTPLPPPLWWRTKAESGGQFVEQCTHLVDLARWIGGEITEVSAFAARGFITDVEGFTADDALVVNARFASGAVGNFTTGCFPRGERSGPGTGGVGMTFASRSHQCTLTDWALDLVTNDASGKTETLKSVEDIFEVQARAFVEAVKTSNPSLVRSSYRDGLQTLRVTLAAEQSALTGQVVTIEDGTHE